MQRRHMSVPDQGSIALLAALCFIPLMLGLAVIADGSRTWVARERLQNGVEASAVAVAKKWITSGTMCQSTEMSYIDSAASTQVIPHCSTTGTNKSGTVIVSASGTVDLMFSNLLGRTRSHISASTGVKIGAPQSVVGLWPFALCSRIPEVDAWLASQLTSSTPWTITFQSQKSYCASDVSGNWGTIDFNGGSNSTAETNDWITNGYTQKVSLGDYLPGNPGVPSSSLNVSTAIGSTFLFALFDTATGTGNGAKYHVVGFATATLISARLTGGNAQRSLTIQFKRAGEPGSVGTGNVNYGLTSWAVCSHDSQGVCK
jgi:hypothetical protein